MTSASLTAIIWKGREILQRNENKLDLFRSTQRNKESLFEKCRSAIADGLFFGGIFWMTSASLTAIIWKGREILQRKDG